MKNRILFYYHHFGGLGHGARIYSLCSALKKAYPQSSLVVINSGRPQPYLKIDHFASVVNLEPLIAKSGLFSDVAPANGPLDAIFEKRWKIISRIVTSFKPQIVVFEHFPFGREGLKNELSRLIKSLQSAKIPIYSSARDIITQDLNLSDLSKNARYFTGFFVHSNKKLGFVTSFKKEKDLLDKIVLTGRFSPYRHDTPEKRNAVRKPLGGKNNKLIVLSTGGGIDGSALVKKIINIKPRLDKFFKTVLFISTGPSINEGIFKEIKNLTKNKKGIIVNRFVPDLLSYIKISDLYITMGGYNSVNNSLFTGVKTIVFPRNTDDEQQIRSKYFKDFFHIIDPDSPESVIFNGIKNSLEFKENRPIYKDQFDGEIKTARLIEKILNLRQLKIRLTTSCNCACDMCSWKNRKEKIRYPKLLEIIRQAAFLNIKSINFTGGEPTLYPHFKEVIKSAKSRGFQVSVSTNGIMKKDMAVILARYADFVDISLNSYDNSVDSRIRGLKNSLILSIETIKTLKKLNTDIKLHINVTVRPDNYRHIHEMVETIPRYIDSISFTLVDTSVNHSKNLRFTPRQLKDFYLEEVPQILKKCLQHQKEVQINPFFDHLGKLNTPWKIGEVLKSYKNLTKDIKSIFAPKKYENCMSLQEGVRVNANGEISPCCFLDDTPIDLGNVNNQDLVSILSSEKYSRFINERDENKNICSRCKLGYRIYSKFFN